jgi:excisionase family DNA binding protein
MVQYSTQEAAERIGISFITLKRWVYSGKVRAVKDERGWWRIEEEEVNRLVLELRGKKQILAQKILSLLSTKKVAYQRELQVCFEEDYLHKDVYQSLLVLLKRGRINTYLALENRWFFLKDETWGNVEPIAKVKAELANFYEKYERRFEANGIVYMDYSEYLVEQSLIAAGYTVVVKDAYSFNGRSYRQTETAGRPTDLDFIAKVPKKDVFIGIQVKNRMQHPSLADVNTLLKICTALRLKPLLIARIIHPKTYELLKENGGRALRVKRYFFKPPFPRDKFKEIVDLGIPLGVYNRPPDFLIEMLKRSADYFS